VDIYSPFDLLFAILLQTLHRWIEMLGNRMKVLSPISRIHFNRINFGKTRRMISSGEQVETSSHISYSLKETMDRLEDRLLASQSAAEQRLTALQLAAEARQQAAQEKSEKRLSDAQLAAEARLKTSKDAAEARLKTSQDAAEARFKTSQDAAEARWLKAQKEIKAEFNAAESRLTSAINLHTYKVAVLFVGGLLSCIAIFEQFGIEIRFPWRDYQNGAGERRDKAA